jgi:hypothetical protein
MSITEKKIEILEQIGATNLLDRTLNKLIMLQIARYQMAIQQIVPELETFEKRFHMTSDECYAQFNAGTLGDDEDFFEWVSLYENVLLYQERLNLLGVSVS